MIWKNKIKQLTTTLENLSVRNIQGNEIPPDEGFSQWKDMTYRIRDSGQQVFLIGNGASASMASHVAADLANNGHVRTEIFTDSSLITAIANDISYEHIFSKPLKLKMIEGDMLVAISSSGNSPNVVRGAETAIELGGSVVTISAMSAENRLRKLGHINFYIPAQTYGLAESGHAAILHYWIDLVIGET
jgi:D-sedoheptulose 7-phosphate isomerase